MSRAEIEQRGGRWVVLYAGAVVGRHTAKFRAVEQAARLNEKNDMNAWSAEATKRTVTDETGKERYD